MNQSELKRGQSTRKLGRRLIASANRLQADHPPVFDEISEADAYQARSKAKTNGVGDMQEDKVVGDHH